MENLGGHHQTTAPSVTVMTIHTWLSAMTHLAPPASSSDGGFITQAVNLSWLLANHLLQQVASGSIGLADIAVERVLLFVEQRAVATAGSCGGTVLAIHGVQFQGINGTQQQPPIPSRAACAALGNILLELFSRGQSSLLRVGTNGDLDFGVVQDSSNGHQHHQPPPMQRRRLSVTSSGSIADVAEGLLLGRGMPLSIRRLVCDLLDAINEPCPQHAITSLEETLVDLTQMRDHPGLFLFDRTCPQKALDDTGLFANVEHHLVGRELEIRALERAKAKVQHHVFSHSKASAPGQGLEGRDFLCETVFLSGYAGSGKSVLLQSVIKACDRDGWFIVRCKFDKQIASIKAVANSLDDFFGMWAAKSDESPAVDDDDVDNSNHVHGNGDPSMIESFKDICHAISSTIDSEGICQLYEIMPSLGNIFPWAISAAKDHNSDEHNGSSSIDKVGAATTRRLNLFHVLFKSICSVGRPVLVTYDDQQWASGMEGMKQFIISYATHPCAVQKCANQGMMIIGTFRSNEVSEKEGLMKTIESVEQSHMSNVTKLSVEELTREDISKLISIKLCLPVRYTRELANLVLTKTRGNPFFVTHFLKSIIQDHLLEFSVQSRQWEWEYELIDLQMISDGVAQLLTARFNRLPRQLMDAVRIASCFGSQVDETTIDVLNQGYQILSFNMKEALQLAVQECILEKTGPLYQFTHDLIQQAVYESIPVGERKYLHRTIGMALLRSAPENSTIHLLAVDQINIFAKDAFLSSDEKSQYADINATAAKFSIGLSSFEQARTYIDTGMQLLGDNHWDDQYSLSLRLYEMAASISCFNGDTDAMYSRLNQIIANVRSFEDSLTSSSLLAKALAASAKYKDAVENCVSILSTLGETLPDSIDFPMVLNELSVIQTTLASITVEQVKELPQMTDKSKLHAMKFMSMICAYSLHANPLLIPIVSCRMVRMTIEDGFCDDSIVGLVIAGFGLFSFTDDMRLGYRIGKVCDYLIEESAHRDALRSRLTHELDGTLKVMVEPVQTALSVYPERYNSAMLTGDLESAMICLLGYAIGCLHIGTNLISTTKSFVSTIKETLKYQQSTVFYLAMSGFGVVIHLSGKSPSEVDVKSYDELNQIGREKGLFSLLNQNFLNEMSCYFWMRDYLKVVELTGKHKPTGHKRILEVVRLLFEGIAVLNLARQTNEPKWKEMGQIALENMRKWATLSKWNFENMALLLEAECHYLNGNLCAADDAYRGSIKSAKEHKYLHYEALAFELHGIFCLENDNVDEGKEQLQKAIAKYSEWGAMKKAEDVRRFLNDARFLLKATSRWCSSCHRYPNCSRHADMVVTRPPLA